MKRRQKQALILDLACKLSDQGSWCGETHLQKAVFFLERLAGVPLEFEFVLYRHGPFSFTLRDEITAMRASGLMEIESRPAPYGPSLVTTDIGHKLRSRWPRTLCEYDNEISFVASQLGNKGVAELERLATALYIQREHPGEDVESRARRLHQLKPHVSLEDARSAVVEVDRIIEQYDRVTRDR